MIPFGNIGKNNLGSSLNFPRPQDFISEIGIGKLPLGPIQLECCYEYK